MRGVFLDISKAFDEVWHKGLIYKLKQNGISGKLLNLIVDFLSNRKERVVLTENILHGLILKLEFLKVHYFF